MNIMYAPALREMTPEKAAEYLKTAHQLVEGTRVTDLRYQLVGPWLMWKYAQGDTEPYLKHMSEFQLDVRGHLGIGMWCLDPGGTRFYERKTQVHPERPLQEQLDLTRELKQKYGVQILQAHYASVEWGQKHGIKAEVDEDTIALYLRCAQEGGPALKHLAGFTFKPRQFEFGGHTNPLKQWRTMAQENTIGMLRMCRDHNLDGGIWWPGGDGFRNQFGVPYTVVLDHSAGVIAEALDEVPGVPLFLETKPYEPALNNHIPTTMEGILFAQAVEARLRNPTNLRLLALGIPLVMLQPEVGHERMAYQKVAKVWSQCAGRLIVSHENDQPEGNFDQDKLPGTVDRNGLDARLYALKQMGFRGDFVLDVMPEVEPAQTAVEIAVEEYEGSLARIQRVDDSLVMESHTDPEKHRGQLEVMLARAANPSIQMVR